MSHPDSIVSSVEAAPLARGFLVPTIGLALAYLFFTTSAFNYQHYGWFSYLLASRILLGVLGLGIAGYLAVSRRAASRLDTMFLTLCLWVQASHGLLEPADSVEFFQFTGVVYLVASLAYRGVFSRWLTTFAPLQWGAILLPMLVKQWQVQHALPAFVDHFSFPIACLFIGTLLTHLSATRFVALEQKVRLQLALATFHARESQALDAMASQVAHDIRSPLVALRVVTNHLSELAEERRVMIRNAITRIEDIVNDLSTRKRRRDTTEHEARDAVLLSDLVALAISEKRQEIAQRQAKVQIESDIDACYGIFVTVPPVAIKRVFSNLMNNAIDAYDRAGTVLVVLRTVDDAAVVEIRDAGKGIPQTLLPRLTQRGVTHGKAGGSGLGLFHARQSIEACGGRLAIESVEGVGTTVRITLPQAPAPAWFAASLEVAAQSTVVVLDDDASVHQVWEQRFANQPVQVVHLRAPQELAAWVTAHHAEAVRYLCDYELIGESATGLDLIARLGIASQAVLVTSHSEEVPIQRRCVELGVPLLPKGLAGGVPIRIEAVLSDVSDAIRAVAL